MHILNERDWFVIDIFKLNTAPGKYIFLDSASKQTRMVLYGDVIADSSLKPRARKC